MEIQAYQIANRHLLLFLFEEERTGVQTYKKAVVCVDRHASSLFVFLFFLMITSSSSYSS